MPATTRAVVVPAALLALVGSFVAGSALADPGPRPGPDPASPASSRSSASSTSQDASCDELRDHYVDAALPLVGPRGWVRPPGTHLPDGPVPLEELGAPDALDATDATASRAGTTASGAPGTTRATASSTGTTVQEEGVDEPDTVKTGGGLLARTDDGELVLADVSGPEVEETARLPLGDLDLSPTTVDGAELLLAGDTLLVLAHDATSTEVLSLDVSDPSRPAAREHVTYDATLVSARLHGDVLRLVLDDDLPTLDFRVPGADLGRASAQAANEELVREAPVTAWLPSRSADGADPEPFLGCADAALPDDDVPLGTTAVVATTVDDLAGAGPGAAAGSAVAVAGRLPLAYESDDHLFLATGALQGAPWGQGPAVRCLDVCGSMLDGGGDPVPPTVPAVPTGTTHVVGYALDGVAAIPAGDAEMDGVLADRWSLDEHDGVLRLALEASVETADATSVVTLEPRDGALVEVGRLDGLGRHEDLTSVRWFDDLAVLVTFRQVDPLHTVDLGDPARPVALGELEVPGFSSYLHPLGSRRLVGIGEGPQRPADRGWAGWGAQAGLFDVTDLTDVRRLDVVGYGDGSRAGAANDPRQLTWLPRERTLLTVIERGSRSPTPWVSRLVLADGRMRSTTTRVDRGPDLDRVRLVPLPDDRVVLVTGDDATFFSF